MHPIAGYPIRAFAANTVVYICIHSAEQRLFIWGVGGFAVLGVAQIVAPNKMRNAFCEK